MKLGMDVLVVNHNDRWQVEVFTDPKSPQPAAMLNEHTTPDVYTATRRAIVRAAAEIGKDME